MKIAKAESRVVWSDSPDLIDMGRSNFAMIDLFRVGGITQWRKVAALAETFNIPVVSHLVPEIHAHLIAAVPTGLTVEFMPWSLGLYEETPVIENGRIVVPQHPGLGLTFRADLEVIE